MSDNPPRFLLRRVRASGPPALAPLAADPLPALLSRRSFLTTTLGAAGALVIADGRAEARRYRRKQSGSSLRAHTAAVTGLVFLPSGTELASTAADRSLKIWSASRHRPKRKRLAPRGFVEALAAVPGGGTLVTGGSDGTLYLWSLPWLRLPRRLGQHGKRVRALATGDGRVLTSADTAGQIRFWSLPGSRSLQTLSSSGAIVSALVATSDGRLLASGSHDGSVSLWTLPRLAASTWTRKLGQRPISKLAVGQTEVLAVSRERFRRQALTAWSIPEGHLHGRLRSWWRKDVGAVALTPDGRTLVVGMRGAGPKLRLVPLRARRRREVSLARDAKGVTALAVSPDGRMFVSGHVDGSIRLWSLGGPKELASARAHRGGIRALAITPDGASLLSAGGWGKSQEIAIWSLPALTRAGTLPAGELRAETLAVGADGGMVAAASATGMLRLWSLPQKTPVSTLEDPLGAGVSCLAPGAMIWVVAGEDRRSIRLWSLPEGKKLRVLRARARVLSVGLTPDGRHVVAGTEQGLQVWPLHAEPAKPGTRPGGEARMGRLLATLRGHTGPVRALALCEDERQLASAGDDGAIRIWSLPDGRPLRTISAPLHPVAALAASPDGKLLVSGGHDHLVHLWSVADGRALASLRGHQQPIRALCVSADGTRLASGDTSGVVILWDLVRRERLAHLCDWSASRGRAATYHVEDPKTGRRVTYTLPCGSAGPAGAVCACHCVRAGMVAGRRRRGRWRRRSRLQKRGRRAYSRWQTRTSRTCTCVPVGSRLRWRTRTSRTCTCIPVYP